MTSPTDEQDDPFMISNDERKAIIVALEFAHALRCTDPDFNKKLEAARSMYCSLIEKFRKLRVDMEH